MKATSQQYASALYELVKGKGRKEAESSVSAFAKAVFENGDAKKIDSIIGNFIAVWNENEGILSLEITSAKELGKDLVNALKKSISEESGAKEIELKQEVDKSLLGGFILRGKDKIIDASVRTKLKMLKERMVG
jgi:F-type H+-transporting ATPase subunit delta